MCHVPGIQEIQHNFVNVYYLVAVHALHTNVTLLGPRKRGQKQARCAAARAVSRHDLGHQLAISRTSS